MIEQTAMQLGDENLSADNTEKQIQILQKEERHAVPMAMNEKEGIKGVAAIHANQDEVRVAVKISVLAAHISMKRSYTKSEATFLIDSLKSEILRSYPGIRTTEIRLAIHKGAMGDYGTVYNLSLATFVGFIRSYMNSQNRQEQLKLYLAGSQGQLLLAERTAPTEAQLAEKRNEIVIRAFETFKKSNPNNYNDHGNYVFETLAKMQVINFTPDEVNEIWKQARKNVFDKLFSLKGGLAHSAEKKQKVEEVKSNPDHYLFYMEAKSLGLKLFFTNLVIMDIDLKDLLDTAEI